MLETIQTERIRLASRAELDPVKTFDCGQCFRWNMDGDGVYTGVAFGRAARVVCEGDGVYIFASPEDYEQVWRDYFDLDTDYAGISEQFRVSDYMSAACDFGAGIRILRQERWEALCSFIISQCNNIPRIKGIVERLCALCGEELEFMGSTYRAFPPASALARLEPADLAPIRSGYRAEYIINAARAVDSGELDLEYLANSDIGTAMDALLSLKGVGRKVANCAVLFGLGHMEAFPIDVWMKRALKEHFPAGFDPSVFGDYAGLAQQYIFYYARSGGESDV